MELHVKHNFTEIKGVAPLSELRSLLSFNIPTNFFMLKAKMPNKPLWLIKKIASKGQTINLLSLQTQKFPTGLLPKVIKWLDDNGYTYVLNDRRKYPWRNLWRCTRVARPYQKPSVASALKHRHGILNVATRGGKTVIAQVIAGLIGLPTLFVVKSEELFQQAIKSWQQAFPHKEIGMIGSGRFELQEITIALIQTLIREKDEFDTLYHYFKLIFFDEVHNFGGIQFFRGAMKFNAPYRFGLSGTAFRNDDAGILLNALCGEIISKVTTQELEDLDIVYKTKILMQHVNKRPHFPMSSRDWNKLYAWGIVHNDYRNELIMKWAEKLYKANMTVLIIVKEIVHGKKIQNLLLNVVNNPQAIRFMNGKEDKRTRQQVLKRFCQGFIPFLIGTKIYNEGVDFVGLKNPKIKGKSVIFASGGKSKIENIQVSARPTTKEKRKGMKDEALIIDFMDNFHNKLMEHSLERRRNYKKLGQFQVVEIKKELDYNL